MPSFAVVICVLLVVTGSFGFATRSREPRLRDGRIVGGADVGIQDHPYQLSFQQYKQHICGASIISPKWAITAGHCVGSPPSYYRVGAGSARKSDGSFHAIKNIIRHPQFDMAAIDYDIALLEVEEEFEFSETVQPVELPDLEIEPWSVVNVTGWGALWQGGSTSRLLQKVTVPIIPRELCSEAYSFMNDITPRMICAGNLVEGGKDSCQGDSGGPLVANDTLYGIVSWGYGCARPKYPGVYTNVAVLRDWIRENSGI
ncbi:trypsin-2-like [Athalia rosae]|uniref:trypsin-2-like n=1 Tax=Athalia rosae TaxID=37344 RepID=UPI00203418C1|nr:trypsin-2-like [Athalia rosae]XP_048512178.1 trypsin-2-like [Athalia rosae]